MHARACIVLDCPYDEFGDAGAAYAHTCMFMHTCMHVRIHTCMHTHGHACIQRIQVGDGGAAAVASALEMRTITLTRLNLDANGIGTLGAASLAAALLKNRSLLSLQIRWNPKLGSGGAASFAAALLKNPVLQRLDIGGCKVGATGAASLGAAVESSRPRPGPRARTKTRARTRPRATAGLGLQLGLGLGVASLGAALEREVTCMCMYACMCACVSACIHACRCGSGARGDGADEPGPRVGRGGGFRGGLARGCAACEHGPKRPLPSRYRNRRGWPRGACRCNRGEHHHHNY